MKKLFDKKFVHFMWDDELEGKKGFFADDIESLCKRIDSNTTLIYCASNPTLIYGECTKNKHNNYDKYPFRLVNSTNYTFFYYDPNYEVKKAYTEGKQIQCKSERFGWVDCDPEWVDNVEYRIKPEETYIVYLDENNTYFYELDSIAISNQWREMFRGTKDECIKWIEEHKSKLMSYEQLSEHLDKENLSFNNLTEKEYFKLGYLYCLKEIRDFLYNNEVK